ncbi:MAG: flagellar biosynthetic protein FliP, partial [Bacteroidetes bacterium]|nr:flagellar biosynthetic protein FliP [Bacteroidota bacterium]
MNRYLKVLIVLFILFAITEPLIAQTANPKIPLPKIGIDVGTSDNPEDLSVTLQILLLMTILSLAPSIMIMTTAYLRIIIAFNFLRQALGTMQLPPNQILAGLALFITFFIMAPTWSKVNDQALQPYLKKEISVDTAYARGIEPIREFMFKHTRSEDIALFISFSEIKRPESRKDLPTYILIPAFIMSELRAGFII